jgi:hypothetical protein
MKYLKWKLSNGLSGTYPVETIANRGGRASTSCFVSRPDGYRIAYLSEDCDLTGLETWDVSEQTEAEALTFCQQFYEDAEVGADGRITGPLDPELE